MAWVALLLPFLPLILGEARDSKQLLPSKTAHPTRTLLLETGVSATCCLLLAHRERRTGADSKLAKALMTLPGQPSAGALNLLLVQGID